MSELSLRLQPSVACLQKWTVVVLREKNTDWLPVASTRQNAEVCADDHGAVDSTHHSLGLKFHR